MEELSEYEIVKQRYWDEETAREQAIESYEMGRKKIRRKNTHLQPKKKKRK